MAAINTTLENTGTEYQPFLEIKQEAYDVGLPTIKYKIRYDSDTGTWSRVREKFESFMKELDDETG